MHVTVDYDLCAGHRQCLLAGQRGSRVVSSSFVGLWTTTPAI